MGNDKTFAYIALAFACIGLCCAVYLWVFV